MKVKKKRKFKLAIWSIPLELQNINLWWTYQHVYRPQICDNTMPMGKDIINCFKEAHVVAFQPGEGYQTISKKKSVFFFKKDVLQVKSIQDSWETYHKTTLREIHKTQVPTTTVILDFKGNLKLFRMRLWTWETELLKSWQEVLIKH